MYDSFDMACHDEDTALRLNIKVNSENLLPTQKYNLGSLRLPDDPSWPKIPQRRLADDAGDLVQPPCIVTSNATPRRSRTVVRTPQFQSCKLGGSKDPGNLISRHCCGKAPSPQSQLPKRRSGCTDPRFKKVTTVKSQMTSTDFGEREFDKQIETNCSIPKERDPIEGGAVPWKEMTRAQVIQQEAEKPDETKGTESVGIQTVQTIPSEITSDMNPPIMNEFIELNQLKSGAAGVKGESFSPTRSARKHLEHTDTPGSSGNNVSFRIDRSSETQNLKNLSNGSSETIPPASSGQNQRGKKCGEVQIPLLSYQNVPVQISTKTQSRIDTVPQLSEAPTLDFQSTSLFKNIKIPKLELPNDAAPQFLSFGDTQGKPFFDEKMENFETLEARNKDTTSLERESNFKYESKEANILASSGINGNHRLRFKSSPEKLMKNIHNEEKCRPQQNLPNIFQDSLPQHNFHIYCHQDKPFQSYCTNVPQKLRSYHAATTDSESEGRGNLMKGRSTKNGNCIYARQQTTDSESGRAAVPDNKQRNFSQASEKLETSFFDRTDDHDHNKDFQPMNRKANGSRDHGVDSKYKAAPCFRQKRKLKSEQHLMLDKKRVQSSEPQITGGRRSQVPYLKKANSYLSKYTHQLTPDSESTYVFQHQQRRRNEDKMASEGDDLSPNLQHAVKENLIDFVDCEKTRVIPQPADLNDVKRDHCVKPYERPSRKNTKISSSSDLRRQNFSSHKSPRAGVDKPTAIPVKTQQLLNKSYWEYYNKLKLHKMENGESPQQQYFCQVAMGAPQSKKRRAPELIVQESNDTSQMGDQVELSLPEIRTLEQCSVLSTMINKTLDNVLQPSTETMRTKQLYLNGNMKSSSDPTAGTQSAILKRLFPWENEDSIVSSTLMCKQKHKRDKNLNNNRTFRLKSIGEHPVVFFGCMVYAMIVFLPMIYDYFSYEEHDEYENLSYVEIAFDYILASFKEAFGEFIDMMNKIFFKPRSCRKCNNLT